MGPEHRLVHPDGWAADQHGAGRSAEAWTEQVLGSCGFPSAIVRRAVASIAPGALGTGLFGGASPAALRTLTLLCTAWALYDDHIEGTGRPDRAVSSALRTGRAAGSCSPLVRAFAEVGSGLAGRSVRWQRRWLAGFDSTVATVREERRLRDARVGADRLPSVARYLAWRRVNIGLHAMLPLVEHALDVELPESVTQAAAMRPWVDACTDVFLAINDHASGRKDGAGRLDLAVCLARERDLDPWAAQAAVADFHAESVARVEARARALAPRCDAATRRWMGAVHRMLAGFSRWHDRAPRYLAQAA